MKVPGAVSDENKGGGRQDVGLERVTVTGKGAGRKDGEGGSSLGRRDSTPPLGPGGGGIVKEDPEDLVLSFPTASCFYLDAGIWSGLGKPTKTRRN